MIVIVLFDIAIGYWTLAILMVCIHYIHECRLSVIDTCYTKSFVEITRRGRRTDYYY